MFYLVYCSRVFVLKKNLFFEKLDAIIQSVPCSYPGKLIVIKIKVNNQINLRELSSADLEVQLVQLNHCDGVYSNY